MRSPLIALTGVTGFIGGRIARHLSLRGFRLRALVRPESKSRLPGEVPLEVCLGSLADGKALASLLDGVDGLVHCAGLVRGLKASQFDAVNVAGTERLVRLARQSPTPPRLILISSLAARQPKLSPYALSKFRAEQSLARLGEGLSWLVLRPPAVYGPGDRELLPLLKTLARGVVPILGPADGRFSLLFVDDLARAVEKALVCPEVRGQVLELHDGKPGGYGWDELPAIAEAFRGGKVVRLPLPEWSLRAAAGLAALSAWVGRSPMLTQGKVNELRYPDWVCDNNAIGQALDWQPEIQLVQGLRLTLGSARAT
ncbi:NAD-dependent epimerase/dehydratase family protein [Methylothermus subterraneus]